jgi:hypothetical protein
MRRKAASSKARGNDSLTAAQHNRYGTVLVAQQSCVIRGIVSIQQAIIRPIQGHCKGKAVDTPGHL